MSAIEGIRDELAGIARQDFPALNTPPGPHSYRVIAVRADGRCDLQAVKDGPPPELPNVDHWTSSGMASRPALGSIVVVSFLDGDPAQPMIGTYQPLRMAGGTPSQIDIDATTQINIGASSNLVFLAPHPFATMRGVAFEGCAVTLSGITITAPAGTLGGPCVVTPGPIVLTGTITTSSTRTFTS